jgi:mono/diheme cytochrome c family protein
MRRWQKALLTIFLVIVVLLILGITFTIGWRPFIGPKTRSLTDRQFEASPGRLLRGEYIVRNVAGCLLCHSELDTSVEGLPVRAETAGAGRSFAQEGIAFLNSPNITPDAATGAGNWSDDMLARAIREGIGHDGRTLFPLMPYANYRTMSDEDLASVVTYLRSLPAISKQQPASSVPFPVNRFINAVPQPISGAVPEPDLSTPEKRGQYLVTLASCSDCHTPMDDRGQYMAGLEFAGGNTFLYADREPKAAANITPAVNGIPYYTEELFLETIRTGRVRERKISDVMPWGHYRKMTDEDLKSIFAYLKTLEPIDHYVDNAQPPTKCARCTLDHGGGQRNKGLGAGG